jgi:hypothetical protein
VDTVTLGGGTAGVGMRSEVQILLVEHFIVSVEPHSLHSVAELKGKGIGKSQIGEPTMAEAERNPDHSNGTTAPSRTSFPAIQLFYSYIIPHHASPTLCPPTNRALGLLSLPLSFRVQAWCKPKHSDGTPHLLHTPFAEHIRPNFLQMRLLTVAHVIKVRDVVHVYIHNV